MQMDQVTPNEIAALLKLVYLNQSHYLGDGTLLTNVSNGCRMFVDGSSVDIGTHLLTLGEWEPEYTSCFSRIIWSGARVMDIGANHGWYSIVACPIIGKQGKVLAVEANPRLAKLIEHSFSINGFGSFAKVATVAASDAHAELEFSIQSLAYSGGGVTRRITHDPTALSSVVPCNTIDNLASEYFGELADVIKIDIEGWEGVALMGAINHLKDARRLRILIEWSEQMDATEVPRKTLASLLKNYGFIPYTITHGGQPMATTWDEALEIRHLCNLLVARTCDKLELR